MGIQKCCVGGCNSTSATHRLFSFPKNDNLRKLWMSFLVPTNSDLIVLSKDQLLRKRVCEKHFDEHQFDFEGKRLRYSYPCLLNNEEIAHGVPLSVAGCDVTLEHNYFKQQDEDVTEPLPLPVTTIGSDLSVEHNYFKDQDYDRGIKIEQPSCSDTEYDAEDVTETIQEIHGIQTPIQKYIILEDPSCSDMEYNAEVLMETLQAVQTSQQKYVIIGQPSCSDTGYNAENAAEVQCIQTPTQEYVIIDHDMCSDTEFNAEVVMENLQAVQSIQTPTQNYVIVDQASCSDLEYNDEDVTETLKAVQSIQTPTQKYVIIDEPSCSQTGYNAEEVTETVQVVPQFRTPKQKRATIKKIGSKNTKCIKNVTEIASENSDQSDSKKDICNKQLFSKFNLLNEELQTFFLMQLKQAQKSKMARRFTLEEKVMASLLMKQSPECYKVMEKMFTLPNKRTLLRLYKKASMEQGLNAQINDHTAQN